MWDRIDIKALLQHHSRVVLVALIIAAALITGLQWGVHGDEGGDGLKAAREAARSAMVGFGMAVHGQVWLMPLDAPTLAEATELAAIAEVSRAEITEGQRGPRDIARVSVTRAPEGQPVRVGYVFNLTETDTADERVALVEGQIAVIAIHGAQGVLGLLGVDFSGESAALTSDWSGLDQRKNQISNWQETGQLNGLGRQRIMFSPSLKGSLSLKPHPDRRFDVWLDDKPRWSVALQPGLAQAPVIQALNDDLGEAPRVELQIKGQRPHLAWVVDTVRDHSWVGPAKIAKLEDIAFTALDFVKRQREAVLGPAPVAAPELAAIDEGANGDQGADAAQWANIPTADGEGGQWRPASERQAARIWPPPAGKPVFEEPGPGEGQWVPMTRLIKASGDKGVVFYQSWLRPDRKRAFAQVAVTAWDPSRLKLGVVAGTREPESRTGLRGTGRIPRRDDTTPRLVAAFNGGFQSKHGKFGMVEEKSVIAPPMGDAATVSVTDDGRALLGVWPPGEAWVNRWTRPAGAELPPWVFGMRQNLDSLVEDGKVNPTGRRKWGSTAGATADGIYTTRTGICLLKGGALAYFFGTSVSADILGQGMAAYQCEYGVHLDMNSGHSGFEFYRVEDVEGTDFKAERMIRNMWHMNFPRYIKRDGRDFFFLTLRQLPVERLAEKTGLSWRHPTLQATEQLNKAAARPTPPGPPAQVLLADLTLAGGETHVELVRLPRARATLSTATPTGDDSLPVTQETVLLGNLDDKDDAKGEGDAPWPELVPLSLNADAPWPKSAQPGTTLDALPLLVSGDARPLPEALPARMTVFALTDQDLLVTQVSGEHLGALVTWLKAQGAVDVGASPCPSKAGFALRLVSDEDREAFRGGPLRQDRALWRLSLTPSVPMSGRVEDELQGLTKYPRP